MEKFIMETKKLAVSLPGLELKNPIMPASGTFGFGDVPSANKYSLDTLGALVIKTTTPEARTGNPDPKISVIEDGVLNAVDRKSTRLNSSDVRSSYTVCCLT